MTLPLPHISDQTTQDAWSYRATLQINQDLARIDSLETRIENFKRQVAALENPTVEDLVRLIGEL